jgi:hypothetical protein
VVFFSVGKLYVLQRYEFKKQEKYFANTSEEHLRGLCPTMSARAGRTASKRSYTQNSGSESEGAAEEDAFSPVKKAKTQRRPRVVRRDSEDEDSANSVDGNDENELNDVLDGKNIPFEAGQIMTVSVQNFMCHRKFTMNFGRHLNFITGRNGSGKSLLSVPAIER